MCWQSYGGGDAPNPEDPFEKCATPLRQKGWVEACRNRQGAGDNVYFCAAGQKPEIVTRGGCAGCAAEPAPTFGALSTGLLLGLAAAVVAWRRRSSRGAAG